MISWLVECKEETTEWCGTEEVMKGDVVVSELNNDVVMMSC